MREIDRNYYIGKKMLICTTSNYNGQILDITTCVCNGVAVNGDSLRFEESIISNLGACRTRSADEVMLTSKRLIDYLWKRKPLSNGREQYSLSTGLKENQKYLVRTFEQNGYTKISVMIVKKYINRYTGDITWEEVYNLGGFFSLKVDIDMEINTSYKCGDYTYRLLDDEDSVVKYLLCIMQPYFLDCADYDLEILVNEKREELETNIPFYIYNFNGENLITTNEELIPSGSVIKETIMMKHDQIIENLHSQPKLFKTKIL